jgi:hypothetical protein
MTLFGVTPNAPKPVRPIASTRKSKGPNSFLALSPRLLPWRIHQMVGAAGHNDDVLASHFDIHIFGVLISPSALLMGIASDPSASKVPAQSGLQQLPRSNQKATPTSTTTTMSK